MCKLSLKNREARFEYFLGPNPGAKRVRNTRGVTFLPALIVVIVRGSCAFLAEDSQKAILVDCSWHWVLSFLLVLMAPKCLAKHVMPISAWATKWVCRHNEDVDCRQAIEPRDKSLYLLGILVIDLSLAGLVSPSATLVFHSSYHLV
jgi:hypothetical protein